jgi:hypothetical protein
MLGPHLTAPSSFQVLSDLYSRWAQKLMDLGQDRRMCSRSSCRDSGMLLKQDKASLMD